MSASRAHLASPVALAVVSRTRALRAPGGSVLPENLRVGDSFSGTAKVSRAARRSFYPRLTLRSARVTKRSAVLSTAELQALVAKLQADVNKISTSLGSLTTTRSRSSRACTATSPPPCRPERAEGRHRPPSSPRSRGSRRSSRRRRRACRRRSTRSPDRSVTSPQS